MLASDIVNSKVALSMHKLVLYQSSDNRLMNGLETITPGMVELARNIVERIREKYIHTVVIEGPPGVGKTTLMNNLGGAMLSRKMAFDVVSTDDDVLPRSERIGKDIIEFHPGGVVREAINMKASGGGTLRYQAYNSRTGGIDLSAQKTIRGTDKAVLLVEGVRSVEYVMKQYAHFRHEYQARVLYILLLKPVEIVEQQRIQRDISLKGLSQTEVDHRIQTQRSSLRDYYADLERELKRISNIGMAKDSDAVESDAL